MVSTNGVNIPFRRHDLVWLSGKGREYVLHNIQNCIPLIDKNKIREAILCEPQIPAIVRRQETGKNNLLYIGFSFPEVIDGVRLRISSKTPLDCIIKHTPPFDLALYDKKNSPFPEILDALVSAGDKFKVQVGCFGSAALQMVTGLPYIQKNSDLDIYLRHSGTFQELEQFFARLVALEKQSGVIIDAEIEFQCQYGVKLKELFAEGKTVLGKGLYDVALLRKEDIAKKS